jgi:predicted transcriptional regulator
MRTAILVDALADRYGSITAASRDADIPLTTLFKLRRERVDLRVSTLTNIAKALDLETSDVMKMLESEEGQQQRCR